MKLLRNGLFLIVFIITQTLAPAQKLEFEHLTDKDGLVSTTVTSILKDSYGFMWFGTYHGLSRYDGYTFVNYLNDPKNDSSLTENGIRYLYETRDSMLLIGFNFSGIAIYNRQTESFTRLRHNPEDPASLRHDVIHCFYQDKKGNIWVGTKGGLDRFDPVTRQFTHYQPKEGGDMVSSIVDDERGNLWLYGKGEFVYRFNTTDHTFEKFSFTDNFNNEKYSSWGGDILLDKYNNLWIGSDIGNGLFRYNIKTGKKDWYSAENKKLESNIIFSLLKDSEGRIWIGTDGSGVYLYDYKSDDFTQFKNDPNENSSLSANGVYTMYESEPVVIWIGVFTGGVNIYNRNKNKFTKFTSKGTPGRCLNNKSVVSIAEAKDGKIWMGTDGGGLNLFDPENFSFKYYTTQNSIIHSNVIKSMKIDRDENLWLGSYGVGLCKINFDKGKAKYFRGNIHGTGKTVLTDFVWSIEESYDRKIWTGLLNFGLNIYDPGKDEFTYDVFDSAAYKNETVSIYVLFEDSKKRMWVGVENGGFGYYDPEKKCFVKFKNEEGKQPIISSNQIRDIFEDSRGTIWIASYKGGLMKVVDLDKKKFESYTMKDGLPTNNINNILEDDHHNLWLSTDMGISLFRTDDKKFINYDMEDGLQSKEFNYRAALKSRDGYMYFGGIQGFNMFHPDSVRFNPVPPRIVFTDFKLFNKSVEPGKPYNGNVYLEKSILLSKEITLTHKEAVFSIEFAALDLTAPKKNKYAYRLTGFNDQWTYVSSDQRTATYTNLDPGEYIFQVIASNNDGVWNMTGSSLKIIILPPWWMTWWFRTGTVVVSVMLLVGFYYMRVRSIRERNKFLEQEVKKRTAEIMMQQEEIIQKKNQLEQLNRTKDKFFSIIGHDLKGPVKALTSLAELLKEESEKMASEKQRMLANHMEANCNRVQNLVLSLLEWARTQSGQVKTEPAPIPVSRIFSENIELLSAQAAQKQIKIEVQTDTEHIIMADYHMISTVIRNILSNSIKYSQRGGTIELSSSVSCENAIKLAVKDNGVGMSEEVLNKLFSLDKVPSVKGTANETGTGLGLIIAKEFIELNQGKIYAESVVGQGSIFYMTLPCVNTIPSEIVLKG